MAMASTTDDFVDATIANLKIIGMVPKNGKLCIRKGQLCIDSPRMQGVRRWMYGDSRDMTLAHTKNTINSSIKIARSIMLNYKPSHNNGIWTLDRIFEEMDSCQIGLQNLKTTTYAGDSMMVANLDIIMERQIANKEEIQIFFNLHRIYLGAEPRHYVSEEEDHSDVHGNENRGTLLNEFFSSTP
jgi:hypothetical protein